MEKQHVREVWRLIIKEGMRREDLRFRDEGSGALGTNVDPELIHPLPLIGLE